MIIRRNSVTFSPEECRRLMAITEFGGLSDEMHQLFYNERGVAVTFAEFGEVLWWTYRLLQSEWRYNRFVYGVRNPRGLYTGDTPVPRLPDARGHLPASTEPGGETNPTPTHGWMPHPSQAPLQGLPGVRQDALRPLRLLLPRPHDAVG